ncbi:sulfatase-like hydrolase/transferase [Caminibacter pacificus]
MKKLLPNIIFMLITTAILIAPDFITNLFFHGYYDFTWYRFSREFFATLGITFILSFTPRLFLTSVLSLFVLFAFISIAHFAYFHTYLMPYEIGILGNSDDLKDVIYSISDILPLTIFLLILWGGLSFFIYYLDKKLKPLKLPKPSTAFFILLLIVYPYFIHKKPNIYLANFTHFSYFNTLNTLYLAFLDTFRKKPHHNYKPYVVKKVDGGKPIVIMIMGESLNFRRMHLYGWDVNDTPNLDKLAKTDKNFQFKPAISCSVRTICSVTTFFYNKREPDNMKLLLNNKTNIMKLADENGYDTYWLSMQSDVSLMSKVMNFAKHKKFEWQFKRKYDDSLVKALEKIPFDKKTFVVLHLKAVHSPYNKYVPSKFYKFSGRRGDYYNGVLYNDYVISSVINYMKTHHKNFVIYFTSDHGEMLGFPDEHGKYGHSQLVWGDTFVPFLYYSDKYHKNLNKKFYNHYEISKMLTRDLGYEIINPNEDGTYYVNGVQIDGSAGWMHYKFKNCQNPLKNPENCVKLIKKVKY